MRPPPLPSAPSPPFVPGRETVDLSGLPAWRQPPPLPKAEAAPSAAYRFRSARGGNATPPATPMMTLAPLDLRLLADLPSLTLQARYLVDGFLSGRHRSPQKGSSVEFAEYRNYQYGDDLRRVDWRLYGRSDRLCVKQYEEETQLRVFSVYDASASMNYRSRPETLLKAEFARLALAATALLAQRQGDACGLGVAGAELRDFLRARSSASHWRSLLGRLEAAMIGGETALARSLEDLAEVIPARSLVIIASDFYEDLAPLQAALQRLRYDHHDLLGLHVLDPMEIDFDLDHTGTFADLESGARLKLDATAARRGYLERFGKFRAELEDTFHAAGGELVTLRTDRPPFEALASYLAQRERRR